MVKKSNETEAEGPIERIRRVRDELSRKYPTVEAFARFLAEADRERMKRERARRKRKAAKR